MSVPLGSPAVPVHHLPRERAVALLVWAGFGLTLVLVAFGMTDGLPATHDLVTIVTGLTGSLAALSLALVGAVLVTRLPRSPIGWLLWAGGLLFGGADGLSVLPTGAGATTPWVTWLGNLCWVPALVLVALFLPLVFPTGRLPSPRWRLVVALGLAALVVSELQAAFTPFSPGSAPPGVQNPLALGGTLASLLDLGSAAATATGVVCIPLAARLAGPALPARDGDGARPAALVRGRGRDRRAWRSPWRCRWATRAGASPSPSRTWPGSCSWLDSPCCPSPSASRSCATASTRSTCSSTGRRCTGR